MVGLWTARAFSEFSLGGTILWPVLISRLVSPEGSGVEVMWSPLHATASSPWPFSKW
jgi:hypothetical protein